MSDDVLYEWERLPEYRATQQLARSTGRILTSLPKRVRLMIGRTMLRGPILIARGIAGANAELPPDEELTTHERELFRTSALEAIVLLRDAYRLLRDGRIGSQPDLLVALDLLERIEAGLRSHQPRAA